MTAPEAAPFQVSTPAQAEALLDFTYGARLLEQFIEPSIPSQAARALAEPANRVTYHVRKLTDVGLLRVAGRQGKRVLYQVTARTFHVPRAFIRLDEPLTLIEPAMREITSSYARAIMEWQLRRDALTSDADGAPLTVHLSGSKHDDQGEHHVDMAARSHAPAMRIRTVRVTSERYRQAQVALDRILSDLSTDDDASGATKSTFIVMTFSGRLHET